MAAYSSCDSVFRVLISVMGIVFIMATLCIDRSASSTDINNPSQLNRRETPHCTCNPVINITAPGSGGKEALVLMNERLTSLANQVTCIGRQVEQKLKGMCGQMDHRLNALYQQMDERLADPQYYRNGLANVSTDTDATSCNCTSQEEKDREAMNQRLAHLTPINTTTERYARPPDCATLQKAGAKADGVYRIYLDEADKEGTLAYCDLTTDGGGWTVFQRRQDGSVNFYRDWADYKKGFGYLDGEFWFGNDNIHRLTHNSGNKLRIDLEDWGGNDRYAEYGYFYVEGPSQYYRLTVKNYVGDAGDSLTYHDGKYFSTRDRDNDGFTLNCAKDRIGAWWYHNCIASNLNGVHASGGENYKVYWGGFRGVGQSLKGVSMKVRPYGFTK